jgi:hypothetical protein
VFADALFVRDERRRETAVFLLIRLHCQADLLQVVFALHPPPRLSGRLHRRQELAEQHAEDIAPEDEQKEK